MLKQRIIASFLEMVAKMYVDKHYSLLFSAEGEKHSVISDLSSEPGSDILEECILADPGKSIKLW